MFEDRKNGSRKGAKIAKMDENSIGKEIVDVAIAVHRDTNAHKKQLLTYLKLTDMKLGYLLNFGEDMLKRGITRTVNGLPE